MLDFIAEYGLFFAKAVTVLVAVLLVIAAVVSAGQKNKHSDKGFISVTNLNDKYTELEEQLKEYVLDEEALRADHKAEKKRLKDEKAEQKKKAKQKSKGVEPETAEERKKRIYVVEFKGDVEASQVMDLREEITTILTMATKEDEVVIKLESPGGMVHGYGLAASQLTRVTSKEIPLTVCVDMVAASGGYLMACIANRILAAPFAILGSIGVMASIPNVHRLLKKYDVDYDVMTAGEFKRTVTTFGENTEKGRKKFQEELEDTHQLFKEFVREHRPTVNIDEIATGEVWYGQRAVANNLIDEIITSDEYLTAQAEYADIYEVKHEFKKTLHEKLGISLQTALDRTLMAWWQRLQSNRFKV